MLATIATAEWRSTRTRSSSRPRTSPRASNAWTFSASATCPTSSAASSPAAASFSTAAEWDTRPGPIQDRVRAVLTGWNELLEANLRAAQRDEELAPDVDIDLLTFEINALLHEANGHYLLYRDPVVLDHARTAIAERLKRATA